MRQRRNHACIMSGAHTVSLTPSNGIIVTFIMSGAHTVGTRTPKTERALM
jgi:hypothetical protein